MRSYLSLVALSKTREFPESLRSARISPNVESFQASTASRVIHTNSKSRHTGCLAVRYTLYFLYIKMCFVLRNVFCSPGSAWWLTWRSPNTVLVDITNKLHRTLDYLTISEIAHRKRICCRVSPVFHLNMSRTNRLVDVAPLARWSSVDITFSGGASA